MAETPETPEHVPTDWIKEYIDREYADEISVEESKRVRLIWPDELVEPLPKHVKDKDLYNWLARGYAVRYFPDQVLDAETLEQLSVSLDPVSLKELDRLVSAYEDPLRLTGGWHAVGCEPLSLADLDRKAGVPEPELSWWCTHPRVFELLYRDFPVDNITKKLYQTPRLPRTAELLYIRGTGGTPGQTERELCSNPTVEHEPTSFLSMRFEGSGASVSSFGAMDRFTGGVRPVWKIPPVLVPGARI